MFLIFGTKFGQELPNLNFSNFISIIKNNIVKLFTVSNFVKIEALLIFGRRWGFKRCQKLKSWNFICSNKNSLCLYSLKMGLTGGKKVKILERHNFRIPIAPLKLASSNCTQC